MRSNMQHLVCAVFLSMSIVMVVQPSMPVVSINGRTANLRGNVLNELELRDAKTNQSVYIPVEEMLPAFGSRSLQSFFNAGQPIVLGIESYSDGQNNEAIELFAQVDVNGGTMADSLSVPLTAGSVYNLFYNGNTTGYSILATNGTSFGIAPTASVNPTVSNQVFDIPAATILSSISFQINGSIFKSLNPQSAASMIAVLNGGGALTFKAQLTPPSMDYTLFVSSPSWPSDSYPIISNISGVTQCSMVIAGVNENRAIILPAGNGVTYTVSMKSPLQQRTLQGSSDAEYTLNIGRSITSLTSLAIEGAGSNRYELTPMSEQNGKYIPDPSSSVQSFFATLPIGQRLELRRTLYGNLKLVLPNGSQIPLLRATDMNKIGFPATLYVNNQACATISNVLSDGSSVGPLVAILER